MELNPECTCLAGTKSGVSSLALQKVAMVVYAYNPRTWEVEAGRSEVQSHPQPHSYFQASLGHVKRCLLKIKKIKIKSTTL